MTTGLESFRIFSEFKADGLIIAHKGPNRSVQNIRPVEGCGPNDLVFFEKIKYLDYIRKGHPGIVVTSEDLVEKVERIGDIAILIAPNVRLANAYIKQRYADRDLFRTEWPRVHSSSVVHESATLAADVLIGPGVIVGARVTVGNKTAIMANSVLESGVSVGNGSVIHPSCVVGYDCRIGDQVILKSGCIIGSEGQGFAQDAARSHHRIPQTGIVVIEDRVVIGANCTIDRATYDETRIHAGCIIDALCHIAHNVVLEEDCILVAQTGIAGSSRFGKRVIASGQTGVLDHVSVPADTVLLHRAGVINTIKKSGVYAATPPQPFKQYLKNIAVFQRLGEVWKRLKVLEKKVETLSRHDVENS